MRRSTEESTEQASEQTSRRAAPPLDLARCRARFPQLGDGLAYFENAGRSYAASAVIEAYRAHLLGGPVQPAWGFPSAKAAQARIEAGLRTARALVGGEAEEVVLGPSTTLCLYVLSRALLPQLRGGAIVVTNQDHEANSGCWRRLAEEGVEVREWRVEPERGELPLEALDALLEGDVRLLCFPHVSNVVGSIQPVAEICARARAAGALTVVDGVAYAPHGLPAPRAWGADFYVFSLYKVYGPHLGLLYAAREQEDALANQNHGFLIDKPGAKLNPGGLAYEAVAAVAGVGDYFREAFEFEGALEGEPEAPLRARLGAAFEAIARHEEALAEPLLAFLRDRPGVRRIGAAVADRRVRVPTISFVPERGSPMALAEALWARGIAVGAGHFYAPRLLEALGIEAERGVLRVSMVHYNTEAEVARLIEALEALL